MSRQLIAVIIFFLSFLSFYSLIVFALNLEEEWVAFVCMCVAKRQIDAKIFALYMAVQLTLAPYKFNICF